MYQSTIQKCCDKKTRGTFRSSLNQDQKKCQFRFAISRSWKRGVGPMVRHVVLGQLTLAESRGSFPAALAHPLVVDRLAGGRWLGSKYRRAEESRVLSSGSPFSATRDLTPAGPTPPSPPCEAKRDPQSNHETGIEGSKGSEIVAGR